MMNRARSSMTPPPPPSEIVDGVPKPSALLAAEAELAALRQRRDQLIEQTDTLRSIPSDIAAYPRVHDKELRVLERERADVDRKIKAARSAVAAHQQQRAVAVIEALRPARELADAEIDDAVATLLEAWARIDEIDAEARRAGAVVAERSPADNIRALLQHFRTAR
jgi:hypothetical protein